MLSLRSPYDPRQHDQHPVLTGTKKGRLHCTNEYLVVQKMISVDKSDHWKARNVLRLNKADNQKGQLDQQC